MTDLQGASSDTPPVPKAPSGFSNAHVAAAGAAGLTLTQALADAYFWILNWPIHAPTEPQCVSLAVLTVTILGGGGFAIFGRSKS